MGDRKKICVLTINQYPQNVVVLQKLGDHFYFRYNPIIQSADRLQMPRNKALSSAIDFDGERLCLSCAGCKWHMQIAPSATDS